MTTGEDPPGRPAPSPAERFDSWKEVASYLKKSVRTVQRWEKEEGLPVHRHQHLSSGSVYAFREELDQWFQQRRLRLTQTKPKAPLKAAAELGVAVLPFRNLGREAQSQSLAEILVEEIVGALSELSGLRVASPTATRGRDAPLSELARMLQLQLALEGTVRCTGKTLRVRLRMLDAESGLTLKAQSFQSDLEEFQQGSEALARRIAAAVWERWRGGSKGPRLAGARTAEAGELYLQACALLGERTRSGLERALELLGAVSRLQPRFATGWCSLAECHNLLGLHGFRDPREAFPAAREAALTALEIDEEAAAAQAALGLVHQLFEWNWAAAEEALLLALTLRPDEPVVRCWLSMNLAVLGRPFEAVEQLQQAQQLDPQSAVVNSYVAGGYYYAGQFEAAASKALEVLQQHPRFPSAELVLGRAYAQLRRVAEGEKWLREVWNRTGKSADSAAALVHLLAAAGRVDEAVLILEEMEGSSYYLGSGHRAALEIGRGRFDAAVDLLKQACAERFPGLVLLKIDPLWSPLRNEAGFEAILREVGL